MKIFNLLLNNFVSLLPVSKIKINFLVCKYFATKNKIYSKRCKITMLVKYFKKLIKKECCWKILFI